MGELPTPNHNNFGKMEEWKNVNECPIILKPGCIYKFVCCPEAYNKNLSIEGTLEDLFGKCTKKIGGPGGSPGS